MRKVAALAAVLCAALVACGLIESVSKKPMMKPSVTYLHLLRHTPFFTQLDTAQLRWTIAHSKEWEVQAGTVIAGCGEGEGNADDAIWILLDGRWQLEENGRVHASGHADPGKWFSPAAARGDCRLRVTEHGYVMRIARADMQDMLARGFAFDAHLQQGQAYYDAIFGAAPRQP